VRFIVNKWKPYLSNTLIGLLHGAGSGYRYPWIQAGAISVLNNKGDIGQLTGVG